MSQRHRQSRLAIPGYAKPSKEDRRLAHRRERHAARAWLLTADPEEGVAPVVPRSGVPVNRRDGEAAPPRPPRRRRFRHWKTRFWKRRSALRRWRAAAAGGTGGDE